MAWAVKSAKPLPRRRRPGSLQQPMNDDDVGSGELVPTRDLCPDILAVMDEQLQVKLGREATRVAVTAGRLINASQPAAEGEVRSLDRVEEQRCIGAPVLDPQEGRVAFEFRQPERRVQATDNRLKQVAGDRGRVLQLAPREICRVSGEVRDDEEAGLGCCAHGLTLDLGVTPMSIPSRNLRSGFQRPEPVRELVRKPWLSWSPEAMAPICLNEPLDAQLPTPPWASYIRLVMDRRSNSLTADVG